VIRNLQLVLFQAKRLKKEDKHMAKKNERELKACAMSGYNYKSVPSIRLMGQWLETAGFHIGDPVLVKCEDGKLIISLDTARAELIEAEKAFMEKETRRLHERFLKEKKALHAQFVAERQAEYAKDQERGKAYV
jgi:antitoxin component of MazEF toxin-antitoxin module